MITVKVIGGGHRQAQIISAGPPRTVLTWWARTCDTGPGAWLLVKEVKDPVTGRAGYLAIEQK
jgi:hypothetical protein